jgi:hypothetical protein
MEKYWSHAESSWVHYEVHKSEPFILLFRRPLETYAQTGLPPPDFEERKAYVFVEIKKPINAKEHVDENAKEKPSPFFPSPA